jgi:hypothetical protein
VTSFDGVIIATVLGRITGNATTSTTDLPALFANLDPERRLRLHLSSVADPAHIVPLRGETGCSDQSAAAVYESRQSLEDPGGWILHVELPVLGLRRAVALESGEAIS